MTGDEVLPEGVYEADGRLWLLPLRHIPMGWQVRTVSRGWVDGAPGYVEGFAMPAKAVMVEVRPVPRGTEKVMWWEALRDRRRLSADRLIECAATGFVGDRRWVGQGDADGSYVDADGRVEVLVQR